MMAIQDVYASKLMFIFFAGLLLARILSHFFRFFYEFFMLRRGEHHRKIALLLERPVYWILNLAVFYYLFEYMNFPYFSLYIDNTLLSLIALIALNYIPPVIYILMMAAKPRVSKEWELYRQVVPIVRDILYIVFFSLSLIIILRIWGFDIGPVIASAGLVTAAVAFAVQSIISDFFYGVIILFDKRIKAGDFVNVSGISGRVIEVGSLSTKIETWDSTQVTIPNSEIGKTPLENLHLPRLLSKVKIAVGVSYDADIEKVKKTLMEIARSEKEVLRDPAPGVYFTKMGDFALEFTLICYVDSPEKRFATAVRLREKIIKEFRKKNIDIPFPIQTIYLKK